MPNVCRILRSSWGGNSSQSWPPAVENCCSPTIRLVAPVCEQPLKTHLQIPCCTGENFNVGTWKYFYVSIFCVPRNGTSTRTEIRSGNQKRFTLRRVHEDCRAWWRRLLRLGVGALFVAEGAFGCHR